MVPQMWLGAVSRRGVSRPPMSFRRPSQGGVATMTDEQYRRDYAQHLIEQVNKGQMTRRQLLVRASVFGFSATAAGSLLAACGGSSSRARSASPARQRRAGAGHGRHAHRRHPAVDHRHRPGHHLRPGRHRPRSAGLRVPHRPRTTRTGSKPRLAESWSANDDASVWTFKLRQGVTFNDGSPFEAADVVATIGARRRSQERLRRRCRPSGASSRPAAPRRSTTLHRRRSTSTSPSPTSRTWCASRRTTPSCCRATTRATSSRTPWARAPSWSRSTSTKQKCTSWSRTPPTGARTRRATSFRTWTGSTGPWSQDESAANLQLQSGAIDFQPQTVFQGSQALFADPNLRVDVYPGTGIREVAFNIQQGAVEERSQGAPPGRRLLPRPRGHQQGALRRPQQPRLRHLLGADGLPRPARPRPRAPRTTPRPRSCSPTAGFPNGTDIELTYSKYLENPQFAQLIQAQCKPAGINVKLNSISYDAFYAGTEATRHAVAQRADGHRRVGQPAHAGRVRAGHAPA